MAHRWLPAAAVMVLAAALAWFNRGERVALDLGLVTFYRAPLTVVLFLAFLAGMLSMLWLGLRHDRRVRDELRRHGLLQPAAPSASAASAWGPAPARVDQRAAAYPADEEERTVAYPRDGEHTAAYSSHAERPIADPRDEVHPGADEERTIAYPREDDRTAGGSRDEEPSIRHPRHDQDPAG